jgi:predicted alpha/beta superfamily hydrolase
VDTLARFVAELFPHWLRPMRESPDDGEEAPATTDMQLALPFAPVESTPPSAPIDGSAGVPWRPYHDVFPPPRHRVRGTVRVLEDVWSPQLGNRRHLLVHLPPSYAQTAATERRYPVLFMHDGQNLFDHATSFAGAWDADDTLAKLAIDKGLEAIVVALPNTADRLAEYGPFIDPRHGGGRGDAYLAFLADTVKPLVDRELRTLPGPAHTGTLGASMGGLISLYALFARPDVFGFAGAMSPSLFFGREAIYDYVIRRGRLPGRIYLDIGTHEGFRRRWSKLTAGVIPSDSVRRARRLAWILERLGYERGKDLLYVEERRGRHHERAWGRRLPRALRFLFKGTGAKAPRKR